MWFFWISAGIGTLSPKADLLSLKKLIRFLNFETTMMITFIPWTFKTANVPHQTSISWWDYLVQRIRKQWCVGSKRNFVRSLILNSMHYQSQLCNEQRTRSWMWLVSWHKHGHTVGDVLFQYFQYWEFTIDNGTNCERLEHIQSSATRESKELVAVVSDKVVEEKMETNIVA